MFLELFVRGITKGDLGWIISKHPENTFSRNVKQGRHVEGSWIQSNDENASAGYKIYVKNDTLQFLETMRTLNSSNYVHSMLSAICPFNLTAFKLVFSSVLHSKFVDEAKHASDTFSILALFGPWPGTSHETLKEWFGDLDIDVKPHSTYRFTYYFETLKNMKIDEFLQKIYVLSYYLTKDISVTRISLSHLTNLSPLWQTEKIKSIFPNSTKNKTDIEEKEEEEEEENDFGEDSEIYSTAESKKSLTLHDLRHTLILKILEEKIKLNFKENEIPTILDYGCATGILSRKIKDLFPESKLISIDCDLNSLRNKKWWDKKIYSQITKIQANLLYPPKTIWKNIDFMVFCEVIEHFEFQERIQLIKIITKFLRPNIIILTTPNIEWNKNIPTDRLYKGKYRHPDHRIEFTPSEWEKEILTPFKKSGYNVREYPLIENNNNNSEEEIIQPSFIAILELNEKNLNEDLDLKKKIKKEKKEEKKKLISLNESLWLSRSSTEIEGKYIRQGMASFDFRIIENPQKLCYLGPTISPVEWNSENPKYLEHPSTAFKYYKEKGINLVTCERKYMGSRAQVVCFIKKSKVEFQIYSRSGREFFNLNNFNDNHLDYGFDWLKKLENELIQKMKMLKLDFIILDGEMLPWNLKAKNLIKNSFQIPGICAEVTRSYIYGPKAEETVRATEFLNILNNQIGLDSDVEYRVFQILAAGKIKGTKFITEILGEYTSFTKRYEMINKLSGEIIKPVEYTLVSLNDTNEMKIAIEEWEKYCEGGKGEGWVVKITPSLVQFDDAGRSLVPMLKVRGKDYLRIVYGMDYLETKYFERVKKRNVTVKRVLSRKQFEIADNILKCFLEGHTLLGLRFVAAFYGVDIAPINATL